MPVALEAFESTAAPVAPPHKQWTRDEYAALEKAGVSLRQYELIDGELFKKMPKSYEHMRAVFLLISWLRKIFGEPFVVQEASINVHPVDNPTSEPEPDAVLINRSFVERSGPILPEEIRLIAEVSLTALAFDRSAKARLYARSGIAEYWILDVQAKRLIVHREIAGDSYRSIIGYDENESAAPLASPNTPIRVSDLF